MDICTRVMAQHPVLALPLTNAFLHRVCLVVFHLSRPEGSVQLVASERQDKKETRVGRGEQRGRPEGDTQRKHPTHTFVSPRSLLKKTKQPGSEGKLLIHHVMHH